MNKEQFTKFLVESNFSRFRAEKIATEVFDEHDPEENRTFQWIMKHLALSLEFYMEL